MKRPRIYYETICAGKVRYASRSEARDAIVGMVRKPAHLRRRNLHSYPCKVCGGFHITPKGT